MPLRLCLDPGHGCSNRRAGAYDPGAVAGGIAEADVVLQWALTLKWVAAQEFRVSLWLTRDDDRDPDPVGTRDDRAEAARCTHFLSLHCNAGGGSGVETYYRDASDREFARLVHRAALRATGLPDRRLRTEDQSQHARLAVLDFDGPACLVEIGFLDNGTDRARLLDRSVRIAFARELLRGLDRLSQAR